MSYKIAVAVIGRDADVSGGQDTTVKLFNAVSGELLHVLKGLEEGTGSFAFSPAMKGLIAGGGWNGHLLIWDVEVSVAVAPDSIQS